MSGPEIRQPDAPVAAIVAAPNLVLRQGLRSLLESSGRVTVLADAVSGGDVVRAAQLRQPDVVVLDARTPADAVDETIGQLSAVSRVLMVSDIEDHAAICLCLRAGATGYLVHGQFTPDEFVSAVAGTAHGRPHLSPTAVVALVESLRSAPLRRSAATSSHGLSRRETEIIEHILRGHGNSEIAALLYLSEKTVKNHINHIYAKLGARHRAEAVARWLGLAEPPEPPAPTPTSLAARSGPVGPVARAAGRVEPTTRPAPARGGGLITVPGPLIRARVLTAPVAR